jgi:hypothetical protein
MSRVQVKQKILKATSEDKQVMELFNDMMVNNIKLRIAHGKYKDMLNECNRFISLFELIARICANPSSFTGGQALMGSEVTDFVDRLIHWRETEFCAIDISPHIGKGIDIKKAYEDVPKEISDEFCRIYKLLRTDSMIVKTCIQTCDRISALYRPYLQVKLPQVPGVKKVKWENRPADTLSTGFITSDGTVSISPVANFPNLNFKYLYLMSTEETAILYPRILQKMLNITEQIVELINIPDTDPDDFEHIIRTSIEKLKKRIPGCADAFRKIEESLGLLKENFSSYYQNLIETENPTSVIEAFIGDVASKPGINTKVTMQFKKIIAYYHKLTNKAGANKDPRIQSMLAKVTDHVKMYEQVSGDNVLDEEDNTADDPTNEEVESVSTEKSKRAKKRDKQRAKKRAALAEAASASTPTDPVALQESDNTDDDSAEDVDNDVEGDAEGDDVVEEGAEDSDDDIIDGEFSSKLEGLLGMVDQSNQIEITQPDFEYDDSK